MELTKQQIQRINDFLEGIGIEYVDIRFEMVDHIASEIENKIENIPAFFENKRFQTPFIKYMLSQKKKYLNEYEKLKNKSFWFYTKKTINLVIKPYYISLLLLFFTAIYFLNLFKINYLSETINVLFFTSLIFIAFKLHQFRKKFGENRIVQSYSNILFFNYIITFYLPIIIPFIGLTDDSSLYLYKTAFMLASNFLVYMSFVSQKKNIQQYVTNFHLN
ncbi:hypothetical protein [uncultured Tenacibaculum sp.]|uniref:hypothetical protein n=1 Tax=uncultured Tenacibaculum sp. TaxID=174713 RepID=UPI00260BC24F|nr:hypothetical protein [uncultured Tenacibaculum sp.]